MLTLEKIAPYLPYGVEVIPISDITGKNGQAKAGEKFPLNPETLDGIIEGNYDKVKLVLHPFQHIAHPIEIAGIEEKTYPMLEIAKFCGANPVNYVFKVYMPKSNPNHLNTYFELQWGDDSFNYRFLVRTDWNIRYYNMVGLFRVNQEFEIKNMIGLSDFVRSMKFGTPPLTREDFDDIKIPIPELEKK